MRYGYARVSGVTQDLSDQIDKLLKEGILKENIYSEKFTGTKKTERAQLNKLLNVLEDGDTLVVCKLDRLSRNTKDALIIVEELRNKGVILDVLNMGRIDDTSTGRLIYTIFMAFSEFERNAIVERTASGKAYKKANDPDFKDGRKRKLTREQAINLVKLLETQTAKEVADLYNISERSVYTYKKEILGDNFQM